jgi:hypothetical protein
MWLMPLVMIAWFAVIVVVIILMVRLLRDRNGASARRARRILNAAQKDLTVVLNYLHSSQQKSFFHRLGW